MKLKKQHLLVVFYLIAIVAANLIILKFGPSASIITAFVFIGLDFTSRDSLHELWKGKHLFLKMMLLIASGSIISFLINSNSARIGIASFAAFAAAGIIDFIVYSALYKKKWLVKSNSSNVFSALADSIIFPTLAFGVFMLPIILGQFAAKTLGGFLWSLALGNIKK